MKKVTREEIKKIFKKVKHLRLDPNLDNVDWDNLYYYSWTDETDNVKYIIYDYKGNIEGIKWEIVKSPNAKLKLGLCDICNQHKPIGKIILVTAKTKHLPKGIDYRTRGRYICVDHIECNSKMNSLEGIDNLFSFILDKD